MCRAAEGKKGVPGWNFVDVGNDRVVSQVFGTIRNFHVKSWSIVLNVGINSDVSERERIRTFELFQNPSEIEREHKSNDQQST